MAHLAFLMYRMVHLMYRMVHLSMRGARMKIQERMLLLSLGLIIWILGTIYYAYAGHRVLETTPARYWVSFAISPIISAAFCILILHWRHIAPSNWTAAVLLLTIPGMVGEAVV